MLKIVLTRVTVLKVRGKRALADVNNQLNNDASHGVRRCNIVFGV